MLITPAGFRLWIAEHFQATPTPDGMGRFIFHLGTHLFFQMHVLIIPLQRHKASTSIFARRNPFGE